MATGECVHLPERCIQKEVYIIVLPYKATVLSCDKYLSSVLFYLTKHSVKITVITKSNQKPREILQISRKLHERSDSHPVF